MNEEEKEELKELINLMYNNHISQYGKRKLESYINTILDLYNQEKESHKIDNENYKILSDDVTALAKYIGLEEDAIIDEMYEAFAKEKEKNKKLEEEKQQAFNDYRSTSAELYKVIKLMASDMERLGSTDELIQYYFKKARGEEDEKTK